jgi:vancomycin resistance protein YoaR
MTTPRKQSQRVHAPALRRGRRRKRPTGWLGLPRRVRLSITLAGLAGLILLGLLVGLRLARNGTLPGLELAAVAIGGLSEEEVRLEIETIEDRFTSQNVTIVRSATEGNEEVSITSTKEELGYSFDIEATVAAAMARGRQGNPLAALGDHLRAFMSESEIEPVIDIDEAALEEQVNAMAADLVAPPREGDIRFSGAKVVRVDPAPGSRPDIDAMETALLSALSTPGDQEVTLETEPVEPETTVEDVDAVLADARTATSAPIRLERGSGTVVMEKTEIGRSLDVILDDSSEDTTLELAVLPKQLEKQIGAEAANLGTEPVDASFELAAGGVRVIPARSGFEFSARRTANEVLKAVLAKDRTAKLRGDSVAADFTTAEAKDLEITEQVSTFTTYHSCCEPRVENIHRIAEIVDGAVVQPGETFSINDYVGPRTTDKGFIKAPAILNGEYVDEVGGGVSQFATTMFNAIFFGGYDFLEYKAHSYYIDRYPMGREATVSSPAPDLAFQNDSSAGVYIDTSYTDTSITVTFYGNTNVDVDAVMGEPFNFTKPETQFETNKSLGPNERVVVQEGSRGFDVVVKREMGDEVERFFTRYLPVPEIVERGPKKN